MDNRIRICCTIVLITLLLGLPASITQARQDSAYPFLSQVTSFPAEYPWVSQYVHQQLEPPRDVGGYVSLVVSPFNSFYAMSYYDATHHQLMIAAPAATGGNCGTDNHWFCLTLDGPYADVGKYSSADFWGESVDNWRWGISYYDTTDRALKAAIYSCHLGTCAWTIDYIALPDLADDAVGMYSSFKFDSAGYGVIASMYFNSIYASSSLYYSHQVPSGGNCGIGNWAGLWQCENIDYIGGTGSMSLDLDYDDRPYVAYHSSSGSLILAREGGLCGPELGWGCYILDGGVADIGYYPSLIAPQSADDVYRIAYYDKTNGYLKYYQEDWGALKVDDVGAGSITPVGISMILDQAGNPVIAYRKVTEEFAPPKLSLARPAYEYGLEFGNCGDTPPGYLFTYWQCTNLDNGGQYTEEANFASLGMSAQGLLGIAYTEYDSYHDATSLKFTYQTYLKTYLPVLSKP